MREQRYISNIDYYAPLDLWMENHIYPSPDGLSVFTRDISEKKRLEKELQEQENKLQLEKLAVSMAAEEKVRNLIGAELHDNVNQLLASANVYLSVIRDKPGRVEELIHNCISSIKQAIHETRRLAHELVAPDLKSESLIMQVEMLCETMLEPAGITAEIKHDQFKESQVSQDRLLALYRILQEQCSNILKYAEATQVSIRFETDPNKRTIMHIKDNGKGMDPTAQRSGIGLRNIATRIEVFGGTMRIETGAGQGFLLEVVLE
ncbi:MAG: histidine kinase [Chitinophagaceae bacterium]|nr:histidine kinase [Chitinophagaceae bacterium]